MCIDPSHVWLFATLWTVAHRLLCPWILQARVLEWDAVPSSRVSSQPRDGNYVSDVACIARWFLYCWGHLGTPMGCISYSIFADFLFKLSLKNPKYILITMSNFREENSKNKKSLLEPTRLCLVNVLYSYCYYTSFCIFSSLQDSWWLNFETISQRLHCEQMVFSIHSTTSTCEMNLFTRRLNFLIEKFVLISNCRNIHFS